MALPKIHIGSSKHKKENFDFSSVTCTTSDFSFVQPTKVTACIPDTTVTLSTGQKMIAAPMPLPTFGMVNLYQYHRWVSAADIWHPFEYMLAQKSYGTTNPYIPTQVPQVYLANLTRYLILNFSAISFWSSASETASDTYHIASVSSELTPIQTAFWSTYGVTVGTTSELTIARNYQVIGVGATGQPGPKRADFVLYFKNGTTQCCATVYLTNVGTKIRKALIGAGYQLNPDSLESLPLLPLFAWYRAYYDQFMKFYTYQWENTNLHRLLYSIETSNYTQLDQYIFNSAASLYSYWNNFITQELACTYYVEAQDFVGAHIATPSISPTLASLPNNRTDLSYSTTPVGSSSSNTLPALYSSSVSVNTLSYTTQVRLELLKRLTTIVNKNTILGSRIDKWLKATFGADMLMQHDSNFIGSTVTPMNFDEIMSNADTLQQTDGSTTGSPLGAFAGAGITGDKGKTFKFTTNTFGYVISFMVVQPLNTNYTQGLNPCMRHKTWDSYYRGEFDGLGYEITPKSAILADNPIGNNNTSVGETSFGYIPRGSSWKYTTDIINGDLSRLGFIDSQLGYTLQRYIKQNDLQIESTDDRGKYVIKNTAFNIPIADPSWRFVGRYAWLSNFDRIFYNGKLRSNGQPEWTGPSYYDTLNEMDNFNVYIKFNLHLSSPMLPIGNSFDTDSFTDYGIDVAKA